MKIAKQLASLALIAALGTSLFAQTSYTSATTQGLFQTDVDNFIDVNGWASVNPTNLFGFLGYNFGGNRINFGLSHQFNNFYGAFFFGGQIDSFSTSASTRTFTDNNQKITQSTLTVPPAGATATGGFTTAALVGIGNMGFKAQVAYDPTTINNTDIDSTGTQTKTYTERYELTPAFYWGMNSSVNGNPFQLMLGTSLEANVNKTTTVTPTTTITSSGTTTTTTTTKTDASFYNWTLNGRINFDNERGPTFTDSWGTYFGTRFRFYGNDGDAKIYGRGYNSTWLTPYYSAEINPVERLTLKARAAAYINVTTSIARTYSEANGTRIYPTNRNDSVSVAIYPNLSLGSQWMVMQDVVAFNMGASFAVPSMRWNNYSNKECNPNDGKVISTTNGVTYNFITDTGAVTWSSGFAIFFGRAVTLDLQWNVLGNVFNGFRVTPYNENTGTSTTANNGQNAFFGNLNRVFFGSNIALLLSVKF